MLQEAIDRKYYDELIPIAGAEGTKWARMLAQKEGIFTGVSGGSTFGVAMQVAEKAPEGSVILAMLPDTGELVPVDAALRGDCRGHDRRGDRAVAIDAGLPDGLSPSATALADPGQTASPVGLKAALSSLADAHGRDLLALPGPRSPRGQ